MEVTALTDPGDGRCAPAPGVCTLRAAIRAAQDGDTIRFKTTLFRNGPRTLTLTAGELVIKKNLILNGPGQQLLTISGNQRSGIFHIQSGLVTLTNVTIAQGYTPNVGGGIYNAAGALTLRQSTVRDNTALSHGGGLYNRGVLILRQSTVRDNTALSHGGGRPSYGGGLSSSGVLTLHQSTVNDNTADYGGGLYGLGEVTLRQSTVSGNTARLSGGGLYNGGVLTLRQSTVSNNTARFGGGLANYGVVTLSTTLILGNRATRLDADCYQYASFGTLQNHGYNLTLPGAI
jgi:hypothetical protein